MKVTVITISDRASSGEYADISGPKIEEIISEHIDDLEISREIVPDEFDEIKSAILSANSSDFIITTGGTGISPRDITPDVTKLLCDKELPGIAEILRSESYKETPHAMISRGYAGIMNKSIIVNFPGSVKAVTLCTKLLIPVMIHAPKMLIGESH